MNRQRYVLTLFATLLLPFLATGLFAAVVTVTLTNGQVLTGELTAETNDVITVDVPANKSGTIFETRIISNAVIEKIDRESADQKARRQLAEDYLNTQKYQLTDSSFPQEYYDRVIEGSFRQFLTKHPDSTNANEITLKIAAWTDERDKVATGVAKRGGQWYDVAASKALIEQARTSAFLKEGDRLLGASQYDAAVMEYREALTIKPLAASSLDQIGQKVDAAAQAWKTAVTGGTDFSGTLAQLDDAQNRQLSRQRAALQRAIDELLTSQRLMTSAKAVEVRPGVQHWIAENPGHTPARYDFGRELPDAKTVAAELQKDQAALRTLDATIAANNAVIHKPQSALLPVSARLHNIDTILQQVADDLAQARIDSQKMETEAALKNPVEPLSNTSSNQVAAAAALSSQPESFSLVAWFKTYWIWLALGAVLVAYGVFRTRER